MLFTPVEVSLPPIRYNEILPGKSFQGVEYAEDDLPKVEARELHEPIQPRYTRRRGSSGDRWRLRQRSTPARSESTSRSAQECPAGSRPRRRCGPRRIRLRCGYRPSARNANGPRKSRGSDHRDGGRRSGRLGPGPPLKVSTRNSRRSWRNSVRNSIE